MRVESRLMSGSLDDMRYILNQTTGDTGCWKDFNKRYRSWLNLERLSKTTDEVSFYREVDLPERPRVQGFPNLGSDCISNESFTQLSGGDDGSGSGNTGSQKLLSQISSVGIGNNKWAAIIKDSTDGSTLDYQCLSTDKSIWIKEGDIGSGAGKLQVFSPSDFAYFNTDRQSNRDTVLDSLEAGLINAASVYNFTDLSTDARLIRLNWEGFRYGYLTEKRENGDPGMSQSQYNDAMKFIWYAILDKYTELCPLASFSLHKLPSPMSYIEAKSNIRRTYEDEEVSWLLDSVDFISGWSHVEKTILPDNDSIEQVPKEEFLNIWYNRFSHYNTIANTHNKLWAPSIYIGYIGSDLIPVKQEDLEIVYDKAIQANADAFDLTAGTSHGEDVINTWFEEEVSPAIHC